MTQERLVSVVLPTYNGARFLAEAIESCRAQTWPHWELIVVDDCSTDRTPEIIRRFTNADPRIRSVRHDRNRKLPAALNTGFALARGEFLTWISDDNMYRPEALSEMVSFLSAHPDVGLVYADCTVIDEAGNVVRRRRVPEPELLLERNPVGWCFLYRRAVRALVGDYAEDCFLAEDYDYWLRVSMHFKLAPLHKDLFCYRLHGSSLTTSRQAEIERTWHRILARHLPKLPWPSRAQKAEAYAMLAAAALARREFFNAARYGVGMARYAPRYAAGRICRKVAHVVRGSPKPLDYRTALEGARRWIANNSCPEGVYHASNRPQVYPEVTGYFVPTLLQIGQAELARKWAEARLRELGPDGAVYGVDGKPYVFDTAQVMRGFSCFGKEPAFREGLRRAGEYLLSQLGPDGSFADPYEGKIPTYIFLYALPPLMEAGQLLGRADFHTAAQRALDFYEQRFDPRQYRSNSHFFGYAVEALLDLGRPDKARVAAEHVKKFIRADGGLLAAEGASWICSPGQAQFALIYYKLGDLETGDRLLTWLLKHQNPSGGFYGAYGRGSTYFPDAEPSWAVKFFVDAILLRIRKHFEIEFPRQMDSRPVTDDFRFQALCRLLPDGAQSMRILEIGCGAGRFLAALRAARPRHAYVGLDLSQSLIAQLPEGIQGVVGDMLNLPFEDAAFDAVFSVEALEHAPDTERALSEMMRVLKPGGRFVIIDKNAERLGRLAIMPWEHWFEPEALRGQLSRWSTDATAEVLPEYDGLFVVWSGTRRSKA